MKKKIQKMAAVAAASVLTASLLMMPTVPVQAQTPSSGKTWDVISWENTIKPALAKTTDVNTVYRELKQGIQYKVLSEGNIRHLYEDQTTKLPIEAVQKLYTEGLVSGYLYHLLAGQPFTADDMKPVFDAAVYYQKNQDIQGPVGTDPNALFAHFLANGMAEGRTASADFNLSFYKANYPDLVKIYGTDNAAYYQHYMLYGRFEGRVADKLTAN